MGPAIIRLFEWCSEISEFIFFLAYVRLALINSNYPFPKHQNT